MSILIRGDQTSNVVFSKNKDSETWDTQLVPVLEFKTNEDAQKAAKMFKELHSRITELENAVRELLKAGDEDNRPVNVFGDAYCEFCKYDQESKAHEKSCIFSIAKETLNDKK